MQRHLVIDMANMSLTISAQGTKHRKGTFNVVRQRSSSSREGSDVYPRRGQPDISRRCRGITVSAFPPGQRPHILRGESSKHNVGHRKHARMLGSSTRRVHRKLPQELILSNQPFVSQTLRNLRSCMAIRFKSLAAVPMASQCSDHGLFPRRARTVPTLNAGMHGKIGCLGSAAVAVAFK